MILIVLPIMTGLIMLADRIIFYVYSSAFANSVIALQILAASLIFSFVHYLMGFLLNAIDKQKLFTLTASITAVFNIVLNIFLIPKYSYIGAGVATLISEVLSFFLLYYFTFKNKFRLNIAKIIKKPIVANIAVIGLIIYLRNLNLILIVILSALAYFIALFLIKGISKEEIKLLQSFIHKK